MSCWWNRKAGMFAHAVAAALDGTPAKQASARFEALIKGGGWVHDVVNRFAYIQIKKVGGGGTSNAREICDYAARYGDTLKRQIELYQPGLIIGCGVGKASPARLILPFLGTGSENTASTTGAAWWRFDTAWGQTVVIQQYHPAKRGSTSALYEDVWSSVREVSLKSKLPALQSHTRVLKLTSVCRW